MNKHVAMPVVVFSPCRNYRYKLTRALNPSNDKGSIVFVMLNPSTATDLVDDPTIRRCKAFADSWGYRELIVVNLYALRSTDPRALLTSDDPVGQANNAFLTQVAGKHDFVVCAWGANAKPERVAEVVKLFQFNNCRMMCLGITKGGMPKHPLYLKADSQLVEWSQPLIEKVGGLKQAKLIIANIPIPEAKYWVIEPSYHCPDGFYRDKLIVGIHNPHTHINLEQLKTEIEASHD